MILGVIFSLTGICLLVALMFQLAVFALPLFAGVTAGRLAFGAGAGWLGAVFVGLLAALLTFGIGQLVLESVCGKLNRRGGLEAACVIRFGGFLRG